MKALLHIFMTIIYSISVIGIHADMHFCGGELSSVHFFTSNEESCGCGESETMSCCSDSAVYAKLDLDHAANSSLSVPPVFASLVPVTRFYSLSAVLNASKKYTGPEISPDLPPPDILLQSQRFLI